MDLELSNRVALVAAASKGIGYACAYELAREGARWAKTVATEVATDGVTIIESWATQGPIGTDRRARGDCGCRSFYACERASYITGVTLQVDGGWVRSLL